MLRAGIVGLPNVGKSTLFNAVTRTRKAESANYPFCTIDPNVGVVTVPDERLEVLGNISGSAEIIPATVEFVDIAKPPYQNSSQVAPQCGVQQPPTLTEHKAGNLLVT